MILTFVRTDPDVPKHKGISVLMIPTDTPGLTRRPFGSILSPDELDFNEVFFDDVEVPAENLIGELNNGWRVATGSLGHERAMLWLSYAERLDDIVEHGGDALREHGTDRRRAGARLVRHARHRRAGPAPARLPDPRARRDRVRKRPSSRS